MIIDLHPDSVLGAIRVTYLVCHDVRATHHRLFWGTWIWTDDIPIQQKNTYRKTPQKKWSEVSQQMVDHLQPPLESQVHVQWREERPFFQRESWYTLAEENPLATAVGLFGFLHFISSWAVGPLASALIPSVPSWRKIREFQTSRGWSVPPRLFAFRLCSFWARFCWVTRNLGRSENVWDLAG